MNRRDLPSYFHRVAFKMGSTQASTNCGDTVVPGGDWNRDGTEEPALFRRGKVAKFILRRTGTTPLRVPYGLSTDQPVSGDWNGDGLGDVGVRRPGWKAFLLRNADGTTTQVTFGKVTRRRRDRRLGRQRHHGGRRLEPRHPRLHAPQRRRHRTDRRPRGARATGR